MTEINPTGNFFQRLQAAYFLVRYPRDFVNGIIAEFVALQMEVAFELAREEFKTAVAARASAEEEPDNVPSFEAPPVSDELAAAAMRAQHEVING